MDLVTTVFIKLVHFYWKITEDIDHYSSLWLLEYILYRKKMWSSNAWDGRLAFATLGCGKWKCRHLRVPEIKLFLVCVGQRTLTFCDCDIWYFSSILCTIVDVDERRSKLRVQHFWIYKTCCKRAVNATALNSLLVFSYTII